MNHPRPTISTYERAEAARITLAAEVATLRADLRQERALRAHPVLETNDVIDLVTGGTDEEYAAQAARLSHAITTTLTAR